MGRRRWMFLGAGLVAFAIYLSLRMAGENWRGQDFNSRAMQLITAELPVAQRDGLVAHTLHAPAEAQDRFVCVQPASATAGEVYEVQFRKGSFGITTNEIYTPNYRSPRTRSIVRSDCLSRSTE